MREERSFGAAGLGSGGASAGCSAEVAGTEAAGEL